jgi:hypothetical protein
MFSTNLDVGRSHKQEMIEVKKIARMLSTKNCLDGQANCWMISKSFGKDMVSFIHLTIYRSPHSMHCQFHEHVCSHIKTRQDQQNDCDRPYL